MLLFTVVPEDRLDHATRTGLSGSEDAPILLRHTLASAQAHASAGEAVLAIDADAVGPVRGEHDLGAVSFVPPEAILNLDPYRPVRPVEAAGGIVLRDGVEEPDVLMIHRNGVWDLPKGKLDAGETPEDGALREVREEVGIERLALVGSLGTTLHGYERGGVYWAKTTYWYRMTTDETTFTPQHDEGIEEVAWVPWTEAHRRVGYESLRRHMANVDVRAGQGAGGADAV